MTEMIDRQEAAAETIRFTFGTLSLGTVLVAASRKGIAAILMGDDEGSLARELTAAFPDAELTRDEAGLEGSLAMVSALIEAPPRRLDLPLDLRGSALEEAVWQALRAVPSGTTVTYGQVARSLPVPATAQEVGAACASNRLAVAVPCHRVVKADGSISGYRWGVRRRRALIQREAAA